MAKKVDLKAKAKRQKIIAGAGAVLLVGVLAIQVPRTMKLLNASAPPPPAAAPTTAPGDPGVSTPGGTASPAAGGGGTLVESDVQPVPEGGQLVAFGRFKSKDPFAQQIDPAAVDSTAGDGTRATADPGEAAGKGIDPTPGSAAGPSVAAGSALIAVNGAEETVAVKADFPKDAPVFTLVSLGENQAKIAIAGGALASGAPTLTLVKGTPVTLVNTADGVRYELLLVAVG